jgi:hypothetical protein
MINLFYDLVYIFFYSVFFKYLDIKLYEKFISFKY